MNLNTNFSAPNTSSKVSFQANFKTEIPIKNLERLANIKRIFSEKTQHYANDTLTLSMSKDESFAGLSVLRTTDDVIFDDYAYSHLAPNLDELMQRMSDNQIAKKLISFFNAMRKEEKIDAAIKKFNDEIFRLEALKRQNDMISNRNAQSGKSALASQFRILAEHNQKKIDSLEAEKSNCVNIMINDLKKITKDTPELKDVPDIYMEFYS